MTSRLLIEFLFIASGGVAAEHIFRQGYVKGLAALICLFLIVTSAWKTIYQDVVEAYEHSALMTVSSGGAIIVLSILIASSTGVSAVRLPELSEAEFRLIRARKAYNANTLSYGVLVVGLLIALTLYIRVNLGSSGEFLSSFVFGIVSGLWLGIILTFILVRWARYPR